MNNLIYYILASFLLTLGAQGQEFENYSEPIVGLNSRYNEEYVAVHPNGDRLAFARSKHPYNQGGQLDEGDVWVSKFDSIWHAATNWHEVNTDQVSNPIGWSSDGSTFLFNKISTRGGILTTEVWAISNGNLQKLDIAYFKNKSVLQSGCFSADNRYIIISMESGSTRGVEDLYVITRNSGKWSAPKNLGSVINTEFQEITPFLSSDNKTLYFATNGRDGYGSFDLYSSDRLDDTWRNWSEPKNLGPAINTSGREVALAFSVGSEYAYFVSTRNSNGYGDIRRIKFKEEIYPIADTLAAPLVIDSTSIVDIREEISVVGLRVLDAKSSDPVSGSVKISINNSSRSMTLNESGIIEMTTETSGEIEIQGYLSSRFRTYPDSLVTIRLEPLEAGRIIKLENVLFSRARAIILESSFEELDRVVRMMKANPEVKILLKGHTDGNGDPDQNLSLSEERAKTVRKYLISNGVSKKRITSKGFGGTEPIASNASEETRKLNRRVEIEILE